MNHAEGKPAPATLNQPATFPVWYWQAGVLVLLACFLYWNIVPALVLDWWNDPNFSHGFIVPIFSGFLVWQNRQRLAALLLRPSWLGLLVVAGALSVLTVGVLGAELFLQRTSLILLLAGLVIQFLGWRHFRALLFPWAFLFLMLPIPAILFNRITLPLQFLASQLGGALLEAAGVPVLLQGNVIQLPTMVLQVVEACSGIRSLMSLGTVALIYGHFLESRVWPRALLALAAVPIAVLANGLRVAGTGLLGHYWSPAAAEGFFHNFSGWIIFVLSLILLFAVQWLIHLPGRWREGRR
jgi:exosortase